MIRARGRRCTAPPAVRLLMLHLDDLRCLVERPSGGRQLAGVAKSSSSGRLQNGRSYHAAAAQRFDRFESLNIAFRIPITSTRPLFLNTRESQIKHCESLHLTGSLLGDSTATTTMILSRISSRACVPASRCVLALRRSLLPQRARNRCVGVGTVALSCLLLLHAACCSHCNVDSLTWIHDHLSMPFAQGLRAHALLRLGGAAFPQHQQLRGQGSRGQVIQVSAWLKRHKGLLQSDSAAGQASRMGSALRRKGQLTPLLGTQLPLQPRCPCRWCPPPPSPHPPAPHGPIKPHREIVKLHPGALQGLKEGTADDMLAGGGAGGRIGGEGQCVWGVGWWLFARACSTNAVAGALLAGMGYVPFLISPHSPAPSTFLLLQCNKHVPHLGFYGTTTAALGVKSIADLGTWKHYRLAKAIAVLAETEVRLGVHGVGLCCDSACVRAWAERGWCD